MRFALVLTFAVGAPGSGDRWLGPDKWRHLVVSALAHSAVYSAARASGTSPANAQRIAIPVAVGVGLGKELRDRRPGGSGFSGRDLAWDLAGVGLAAAGAQGVR